MGNVTDLSLVKAARERAAETRAALLATPATDRGSLDAAWAAFMRADYDRTVAERAAA